jgi:pSer/pThr/pTyr-binding forkhead associated (FHA) protein
LNADIKPAERVINLNPNKSSIKIGRASKSVLKGLLGAADNAWFDSPVMSRNHAEIAFNKFTNLLTIQDTNSMHGTFVNGQKLHNGSEVVGNGDTVVFGNEVRRGFESFPACSFKVTYEVTPWTKSRSYAVPDSSDEEDEDSNFSEVEMIGGHSSGDDVSIESVRPKMPRSIEAIDLTGDDTPQNLNVSQTSMATPAPQKVQHIAAAPHPEISLQQLHRQSPEHIVAVQLDTDSDSDIDAPHVDEPLSEDELLSSSDSDDDELMSDGPSDLEEMPQNTSGHDNVEMQNEQGEIEIASSASSSPAHSVIARHDGPAVSWQTRPPYDSMDIPESHVRTRLDVTEDKMQVCDHDDDNDGSEIGLYQAGQEGLIAMMDDGFL